MATLQSIRDQIQSNQIRGEQAVLAELQAQYTISAACRQRICAHATTLVEAIRAEDKPSLMEVFLAEYGLSTEEGVALMGLAEALLRIPDAFSQNILIQDKIMGLAWQDHRNQSSAALVNLSTWALLVTDKVLQGGQGKAVWNRLVQRLGEPTIRFAVVRLIQRLGQQFVLGETISEAMQRGQKQQAAGYVFSYDMLGEAALTAQDAQQFFEAYQTAIIQLAPFCRADEIRHNPGISIKLSALHPRYTLSQSQRVMTELVPHVLILAQQAHAVQMGLNVDAEESERLDLSLDVIEAVLRDPSLADWEGFGVVVQAYSKRAAAVIEWLYTLAQQLDRKIMVRLVKGAYWDTEIKQAQVQGLADFPVFTHKAATDMAYIGCAQRLLDKTDRIYPQFATHNAHTVAAILALAKDHNAFEFQRLHGMGEALHDRILREHATHCRIYAPVGVHRDLLAYLVRRLLENGANSSFVHQIVDQNIAPSTVAADPFTHDTRHQANPAVIAPSALYIPERHNSQGWDVHNKADRAKFEAICAPYQTEQWSVGPLMVGEVHGGARFAVLNPARPEERVGQWIQAAPRDVEYALAQARPWQIPPAERAAILMKAAAILEAQAGILFALLMREAGKIPVDAIAELREAVDFLRYYAHHGQQLVEPARGVIVCISPWNFPLAIFTGQIAAALVAGNAVLAKPAEETVLIAHRTVQLLHQAGVPNEVLQLLPGIGAVVGAQMTADPRVQGVCFTGSTATAQKIHQAMAQQMAPTAPLIAETGGLNVMIVDSTALPEQAIQDIIISGFQSAGQRCSALRLLYLQAEIAESFLAMLFGAMDELVLGDPWAFSTDIGPVINVTAHSQITAYLQTARTEGRLLKQLAAPEVGYFVGPAVIRVNGIQDLAQEIFGPVVHVATYTADALDTLVETINASGYGLTFGMHSRIKQRVEQVTSRLRVGNCYINRNQIGAIVGSQPFGGEGLSGTGPKAGGPHYVPRFTQPGITTIVPASGRVVDLAEAQAALDAVPIPSTPVLETLLLPGPTGESNRLLLYGKGVVLCLGPTAAAALEQARIAQENGCHPVCIAPSLTAQQGLDGMLDPTALTELQGFQLVAVWSPEPELRVLRQALANRSGPLISLCAEQDLATRCRVERHICIDTTAAGGNTSLLAGAPSD